MNSKTFLEWWPVWVQFILWLVGMAVMWTRLVDKVNGQGERITDNKAVIDKAEGRVDRMEREMFEYRRDVADASRGLARVEKGVDGVRETIAEGNIAIGVQLHAVEKQIEEKDMRTQVRLTRIETVNKIEEKIGPIPID